MITPNENQRAFVNGDQLLSFCPSRNNKNTVQRHRHDRTSSNIQNFQSERVGAHKTNPRTNSITRSDGISETRNEAVKYDVRLMDLQNGTDQQSPPPLCIKHEHAGQQPNHHIDIAPNLPAVLRVDFDLAYRQGDCLSEVSRTLSLLEQRHFPKGQSRSNGKPNNHSKEKSQHRNQPSNRDRGGM